MKSLFLLFLLFAFNIQLFAQDTFSIIAVDPVTGEIGSAGASCVTGVGASGIIDIITKIIPGRGGVNSQAWVCIPNVNLNNAIDQMENGASPSEIIDWLLNNDACSSQNFNPEYRQYGIADFDPDGNPRVAGFTGSQADDYKEDRQGATFSIQGNILLNQTVIDNMENNFNSTEGTLADKLMAAMQGANLPGADSRCLSAGTSSTTAYLLVYRPDDDPSDPYLRLNVGQQSPGIEPIDLLQDLYDSFLSAGDFSLASQIQIFPNPATNFINITLASGIVIDKLTVYNLEGKSINYALSETSASKLVIDTEPFLAGMYFLSIETAQGNVTFKFLKK
ncbi:MAG: DUF1028 domain-containing protein [Flavobacteriaceae bacterium]